MHEALMLFYAWVLHHKGEPKAALLVLVLFFDLLGGLFVNLSSSKDCSIEGYLMYDISHGVIQHTAK